MFYRSIGCETFVHYTGPVTGDETRIGNVLLVRGTMISPSGLCLLVVTSSFHDDFMNSVFFLQFLPFIGDIGFVVSLLVTK